MNNQTLCPATVSSRSVLRSSLTAALVVLFASTMVFASSTPAATFDRTLQVSGPVDLEVLTHSGDVTIRAGSAGTVQIHGKIFMSDRWNILPGVGIGGNRQDVQTVQQNPPIRQEGNSIHIDYVNVHNISVDYEITVPADVTIRSHTGSGEDRKSTRLNSSHV